MYKIKTLPILALTLLFIFCSCKKNSTGGKATISATVMHHEKAIPYATIYIKYGAKEFPGTDLSLYSNSIKTDGGGHTDITGLHYGDYYLYGVGYDNSILETVTGGDHLQIKWSARNKTT